MAKNKVIIALLVFAALITSPVYASATSSTETKSDYIVLFNTGAQSTSQLNSLRSNGVRVSKVYRSLVNGFVAELNGIQVEQLKNNPEVAVIAPDSPVKASALTTQSVSSWGLDRIDQTGSTLNSTYSYNYSGNGVTAYVVDTGVLATNTQLSSRIGSGYTTILDGLGTTDCNGHGTHVSGTIGGTVSGVAKQVTITPVRVLDCSGNGTTSGVIDGLDWINQQQTDWAGSDQNPTAMPGSVVVNMSLGGPANAAMDAAVSKLIQSGITVVVAAGNDFQNACNFSPARVPEAITVAASKSTGTSDVFASYSNYGSCVDVIAPGTSIQSSWIDTCASPGNCVATISGTSMATPHVSGIVALLLEQFGVEPPATIANAIVTGSSKSLVLSVPTGTRNAMAFSSPNGYQNTLLYRANPASISSVIPGSRSLKVNWTPSTQNGGSYITSQSLEVWSGTSKLKTVTGITSTTNTYTVTGLSKTVPYFFRVATINGLGTSFSVFSSTAYPLK